MERPTIIEIARKARGWTQRDLAGAAATSQATVSAYERREKSPSLAVTERLIGQAGYSLRLDVTVDFSPVTLDGQTIYQIPNRLWRVEPRLSFSKVTFPDWPTSRESGDFIMRNWDLAVREDRRRVYGYLLRESVTVWIYRWVDGALLVDLWDELDLPKHLRSGWQPLIDDARNGPIENPIYVGYDHIQKIERDERKERIAALRAGTAHLTGTAKRDRQIERDMLGR